MKILQQGAEATIFLDKNKVIKKRLKKAYRFYLLDEKIRKSRTKAEAKLLEKASKVIPIPKNIKVDEKTKEISMEFLNGKKLSENLDNFSLEKQKKICVEIGKNIAKIHDIDIIHGDLTTSNMVYVGDKNKIDKSRNNLKSGSFVNNFSSGWVGGNMRASARQNFQIFFIDFGLGFISHKAEDKAVDLHLLKQSLEAKHFRNWETLFEKVLNGYGFSKNCGKVIAQFKKVERRGRYKEQY